MKTDNYDEKFRKFYNSAEWKSLRERKFAEANGLCEICARSNRIVVGTQVHHIIPIEKAPEKAFDYDNLILLCDACHNEQHDRVSPLEQFFEAWDKEI